MTGVASRTAMGRRFGVGTRFAFAAAAIVGVFYRVFATKECSGAWSSPLLELKQKHREPKVQKDAPASKELADKFRAEKDSPYLRFVRNDGLDIISAHYVPNLRTVELKPWPRRGTGAKGVYINHEGSRFSNDCYACEIAPGQKLQPMHHLYEEMLLILSGRGSTTVWNNAGARITFEWKEGAIFAIPLNCSYQHF